MFTTKTTTISLAEQFARSPVTTGVYGTRMVERFRRLGTQRYGLWWDYSLSVPATELTADERRYLIATWDQFIAGERPFRRRRP